MSRLPERLDVVVALDPGGTTGYAVYDLRTRELVAGEIDEPEHHKHLYTLLANTMPDLIVCERFDHRRTKTKVNLISREYIGVAKLYAQDLNVPVVMQEPVGHVNHIWSDAAIKLVGVAVEPASSYPHANDAIRHLLLWLTRSANSRLKEHKQHWLGKRKP